MAATRAPVLAVVACSARKADLGGPVPSAADLPRGRGLEAAAAAWSDALSRTAGRVGAEDLYRGRGFAIARAAAESAGADLAIVSAGLGLVAAGDLVPHYDATLTRSAACPAAAVGDAWDAASWWRAMLAGPFSRDPDELCDGRERIVVALPSTYLEAVAPHVLAWERARPGRVSVLNGSARGRHHPLIEALRVHYREGEGSMRAGVAIDFPQRCLEVHLAGGGRQAWDAPRSTPTRNTRKRTRP